MKKLLLIFALLLFSVAAISQTVSLVTVTVTNSTTKTQVYYDYQRTPIIVAPGATASYQVMAEIISGAPLSDVIPVIADTAEAIRTDYAEAVSAMLPIIADSTLWHLQGADTLVTDGALPIKVSGIRVSGTTRLDGTLTLITTAAESLIIGAGGFRNEGGLLQKGLSQFGATGTPVYITADGKVGIGTATSSPYNAFGLVSSTSGRGTGIGLTSAKWNKNRTNWVTASDTSAIGMYIDSAGGPRLSMKAVDGDSLGITLDGTIIGFKSNTDAKFLFGDGNNGIQFTGRLLYPTSTDAGGLGTMSVGFQSGHITDNWYIGGKGQTATQYISGENTITGDDSSWTISALNGVPTLTAKFALPAASYSNGGRRVYMGADSVLFNFARTGRDSSWALQTNGNVRNNNIITIKRTVSLADQAEYTPQIPAGMCGWGTVQIGDEVEWARFRFKADGTVTLEANSTNVGTTNDVDAKLNIYDAGTSGIIIENQLGNTLTAAVVIEAYTP